MTGIASSRTTALSVNVNKVAVLRNSRGGHEPDVVRAALTCIEAGCQGITVHPRPDGRHIRAHDVLELAQVLPAAVEFNIEGNPFAPTHDDYPGLLRLIEKVRPAQATLVPDSDAQLTSDHGFDFDRLPAGLGELIRAIQSCGTRVSLFVDDTLDAVERVRELGADRIEIYTGPYAAAHAAGDPGPVLARIAALAGRASALGLAVNAGHDLSQANLAPLLAAVPQLAEVSIGHALVGEALYDGLATTVRNYLRILAGT